MTITAHLILAAMQSGRMLVVPWDFPTAPGSLQDGRGSKHVSKLNGLQLGPILPAIELFDYENLIAAHVLTCAVTELIDSAQVLPVPEHSIPGSRGWSDMPGVDGRMAAVYRSAQ